MKLRHQSLIAWQRADDLFITLHRVATRNFSLNISESSLAEVWYCLHAATRLGYITKQHFAQLEADLNGVGKPLAGLIRSTKRMPREIDSWPLDSGDQM